MIDEALIAKRARDIANDIVAFSEQLDHRRLGDQDWLILGWAAGILARLGYTERMEDLLGIPLGGDR